MKIVRYFLILFVALILSDRIFSGLMNRVYQGVEFGQSGGKINYLLNNYDSVNILAIGNSRCAHHLVPGHMSPSTYNLSHNGMSLIFHTGLIDQLLTNESLRVDTILLHLEIHELFNEDTAQSRDIQHLKYYYKDNAWIRQQINAFSRYESIKFLFSSYRWNGKFVTVLANRIKSFRNPPPTDGYVPKLATERDSINVTWQLNTTDMHSYIPQNSQLNPTVRSNLQHIQSLCQQANIKLICFTSPIYNSSGLTKAQSDALRLFFEAMEVSYYDYSGAFMSNDSLKPIQHWKDVMHMNEKGAIPFTQNLRDDLNRKHSATDPGEQLF